ncbi:hypothetical protein Tsubulata_017503, partial [Turnera subulata]
QIAVTQGLPGCFKTQKPQQFSKSPTPKSKPKTLTPKSLCSESMAIPVVSPSLEKVKAFWRSQVYDEEKWALNMKLLRAAGIFGGSILLMRNYGDLMAI